ncbi:MAG: thioredoxin [Euryarchaeota archaeon]|nr:thioredoxin [Euryarchaeota archaeon]
MAEVPRAPVVVTDQGLPELVAKYPLVLVDCWAVWCAPCRALSPTLEVLAKEANPPVAIAKLNVDEHPRTAQEFGIMSIPTMLIFKNGKLVDRLVGAMPKESIRRTLLKHA